MTDWLDGVQRIPSSNTGGSMVGGPPRWVWHTYEAGYQLTADTAARALIAAGNEVHFTFNPITGAIVQILPASVAGRGLKNAPGGVQTNRMGDVCIQVEVIGFAAHPWTNDLTLAGANGLARLIEFARSHGILDGWPMGNPPAYPSGISPRSSSIWVAHSGHYGHSQVPENDHGDPGAIFIPFSTIGKEEPDMPLSQDDLKAIGKVIDSRIDNISTDVWNRFQLHTDPNDPTKLIHLQEALSQIYQKLANPGQPSA